MRTLSYYQRAWDDRHPDDYRTAADDAAEQAVECMADFDRRAAERRECEVCGRKAQEMGTEPRCEAHDSEVER